jgi:hypothetical protein
MCMQPTTCADQLQQDVAIEDVKLRETAPTLKPPVLQTTTSVVVILSIVAYLGKTCTDKAFGPVSERFSSNSWFPYMLLLAFLYNIPMNFLSTEKVQHLLYRWRKNPPSSESVLKSISSASSSETLSRLARVSSTDAFRKISRSICHSLNTYNQRAALQAITRTECFARLNYIERLSIEDIIVLYRYSTEINQPDFDKDKFMVQQSQLVRAMVTAIDMAVSISRGSYAEQATLTTARRAGDIDALYYVAVTRILAEWRNVRLVPKGYKRYAVAIGLGYMDVLQNLAKIEVGTHAYLRDRAHKDGNMTVTSPTLRQLLESEHQNGAHLNLPKLADKTAAIGVLWSSRQMHYFTSTVANFLEISETYETPKDAGTAAYIEVYGDYHGWAIRKIFCHSMGGSPPAAELWEAMTPPVIKKPNDHQSRSSQRQEECDGGKADFLLMRKLSDVSEESQVEEDPDNELLLELENLGRHLAEGWEDLLRYFRCVATERQSHHPNNLLIPNENYEIMKKKLDRASLRALDASLNVSLNVPAKHDVCSSTKADPIQQSRAGAANFVREMRPLLHEISGLIDELNMNDPTRV